MVLSTVVRLNMVSQNAHAYEISKRLKNLIRFSWSLFDFAILAFSCLFFNAVFVQKWRDECLTWNPVDYGGLSQIHLDANDIWTPPLILYNK
jgi:hypothetical protein